MDHNNLQIEFSTEIISVCLTAVAMLREKRCTEMTREVRKERALSFLPEKLGVRKLTSESLPCHFLAM